jgi:hypothetical protein
VTKDKYTGAENIALVEPYGKISCCERFCDAASFGKLRYDNASFFTLMLGITHATVFFLSRYSSPWRGRNDANQNIQV